MPVLPWTELSRRASIPEEVRSDTIATEVMMVVSRQKSAQATSISTNDMPSSLMGGRVWVALTAGSPLLRPNRLGPAVRRSSRARMAGRPGGHRR